MRIRICLYIPLMEISTSIDWIDTETEGVIQEIATLSNPVTSVETVNNVITFISDNTIYMVYYENNKYSDYVEGLPHLPVFSFTSKAWGGDEILEILNQPEQTMKNLVEKAGVYFASVFDNRVSTPYGIPDGYVAIRLAYRLSNSSTTLLTPPTLLRVGTQKSTIEHGTKTLNGGAVSHHIITYKNMETARIRIKIDPCYIEKYEDVISSVVVYSTKPLTRFEFIDKAGGRGVLDTAYFLRDLSKCIDDELYYKLDEIDYKKLTEAYEKDYDGRAYKEIVLNEDSIIDDGYIKKTGSTFMFNKRVHMWNINNNSSRIGYSSISNKGIISGTDVPPSGFSWCSVYAKIQRNNSNHYIYLCSIPVDSNNQITVNRLIAIPYAAKSIYFATSERYKELKLTQSKRHNYSYYLESNIIEEESPRGGESKGRPPIPDDNVPVTQDVIIISLTEIGKFLPEGVDIAQPSDSLSYHTSLGRDLDNLIVSEISQPLIYPVSNSYATPGEIIYITVSAEQITQSQIGQYPLYLFTTVGIYGLEQGQGNVLYARTIPLSIEVAIETCQTPYGIVFSTDNGLKVINGGNITELSLDIDVSLNHDIRNHASFKICTDHEQLCRVQPYISEVDFVAYLKGAVIGYDSREKEVIISNPSRAYSYAYSFLGRYWMKRGESYSWFNGNIALTPMIEGATTRPINLLNEEEIDTLPIVYLTVPLALDDHTTIKRSALRGDFKPTNNHMGVYMFASVDKIHWDAVNAMQFKEDTPHAILPRIATTYRWIILLVCGDTDRTRLAYLDIDDVPKYTEKLR